MDSFADLFSMASHFLDALLSLDEFFFTNRHLSSEGVVFEALNKLFDIGIDLPDIDTSFAELLFGRALPWLLGYKAFKFFADIFD